MNGMHCSQPSQRVNVRGRHADAGVAVARYRLTAVEAALIGLVITVLVAAALLSERPAPVSLATTTVRVQPGDSLWSIAARHPAPGLGTAETADLLQRLNALESSTIAAGSALRVPAQTDSSDLAMR